MRKPLLKIMITCSYLILTIAVSAAGFLLPSALSDYQDKQIFARIEHSPIELTELTYSSSLIDTLELLSGSHHYVNYPVSGSKRNAKDVFKIASELTDQLKEHNLIPEGDEIINHTESLQLAIASEELYDFSTNTNEIDSSDNSDSSNPSDIQTDDTANSSTDIATAVVWSCTLNFESDFWLHACIDDKSGKAVALIFFTDSIGNAAIEAAYSTDRSADYLANQMAAFVQDYYGFPAKLSKQSVDDIRSLYGEKVDMASAVEYTIQLKDDSGRTIYLPLTLHFDDLSFNY